MVDSNTAWKLLWGDRNTSSKLDFAIHRSRLVLTSYSKMRSTLPVAAMLLVTALIASSSARALSLGNVAAQSALVE